MEIWRRDKHHRGTWTEGMFLYAAPCQWLPISGKQGLLCLLWGQGHPEGLVKYPWTTWQSRMLSPQSAPSVLQKKEIGIRVAFWWCSPSIPWPPSYFFYSGIFINKILAHLILGWHLLLRIFKLTQTIQVPPVWLLGKDSEGGTQTPGVVTCWPISSPPTLASGMHFSECPVFGHRRPPQQQWSKLLPSGEVNVEEQPSVLPGVAPCPARALISPCLCHLCGMQDTSGH